MKSKVAHESFRMVPPRVALCAFAFMAATFGSTALADSFRCGRWIISPDLSPSEIRQKCGEPNDISTETVDVRGSNGTGGSVKRGETTIERWKYVRGGGAPPMIVTIMDGKVKSIEPEN
jgi:Protein of unknown function (DUF2845)